MAVFPDRIVLKHSGDPQATIQAAIAAGGSDAILPGEVVVGTEAGNVKFFTVDNAGNIVTLGETLSAAQCLVAASAPTQLPDGNGLLDGHMWFDTTNGTYHVYYDSAWVEISGGGGGSISDGSKGDITVSNVGTTWTINDSVVGIDELDTTGITPGDYTSANLNVGPDGRIYAIENGTGGFTDAPADGNQYARQDNAWTIVSASGGGEDLATVAGWNIDSDSTASTTFVLDKPTTVEGALIVAVIMHSDQGGALTPPAGWTLHGTYVSQMSIANNNQKLSVFTKTATASEPATYTWSQVNSYLICGYVAGLDRPLSISYVGESFGNGTTATISTSSRRLTLLASTWLYTNTVAAEASSHSGPLGLTEISDSPVIASRLAGSFTTQGQLITSTHATDTTNSPPNHCMIAIVFAAEVTSGARVAVVSTTGNLASDASEDIVATPTGKTGQLLSVQTDKAAWVTIYASQAARTADSDRTETTSPGPGSGVIAEVITEGSERILVTPCINYFNDESTPLNELYLKVVNKSGSTQAITTTLTVVPTES